MDCGRLHRSRNWRSVSAGASGLTERDVTSGSISQEMMTTASMNQNENYLLASNASATERHMDAMDHWSFNRSLAEPAQVKPLATRMVKLSAEKQKERCGRLVQMQVRPKCRKGH